MSLSNPRITDDQHQLPTEPKLTITQKKRKRISIEGTVATADAVTQASKEQAETEKKSKNISTLISLTFHFRSKKKEVDKIHQQKETLRKTGFKKAKRLARTGIRE